MINILGISAFYHDSAAALIQNGQILSAMQEERLSRIKHDNSFPLNSIEFILKENSLTLNDIDYVVFYEKPFLKFERLLETYLAHVPKGFKSFRKSMPIWLKEKIFQKDLIKKEIKKIDSQYKGEIVFSEHHLSHAASAFFPSEFEDAIILTADGVGEWATSTISVGNNNTIEIKEEINYPHSIGLLYSAFTYYLGFKVNDGEYKIMGLAPYGSPKYRDIILNNLIDLKNDGSFKINQKFFDYSTGLKMINKSFEDLLGHPSRKVEEEISQYHMDIAASIQSVTEEIIIKITDYIALKYKYENLCLAGGVALNCVANSKIIQRKKFKKVWIQPASGDAGGAIGAALAFWYTGLNNKREINNKYSMKGSFLGAKYNNKDVKAILDEQGATYEQYDTNDITSKTAKLLSEGKTIGWFQGRMEFGPRALGNRSILADPRIKKMQSELNQKIKFRESFRPFAPAILEEDLSEWYDPETKNEYMLTTSNLKKEKRKKLSIEQAELKGFDLLDIDRSLVPAVTHVDYSSRVQIIKKDLNERFYLLLKEFKKITGCPMLVNTSFNLKDEPIVCSPLDAYACFMSSGLDYLIIENYLLSKNSQF